MKVRLLTAASTSVQYLLAYAVALPMFFLYRLVRRLLKGPPQVPPDAP